MSVDVQYAAYPTLNPDSMPEYAQYAIAKATFQAVCRYFEQPGVQEKFEEWKRLRAARAQVCPEGQAADDRFCESSAAAGQEVSE